MDVIIYSIEHNDIKEGETIDAYDIDNGDYLYGSIDCFPECLKEYSKKVTINYHFTHYKDATLKYFNSEYDYYDSSSKDGLTFYYDNQKLGFLDHKTLSNYREDTIELNYILKVNMISSIDNAYFLNIKEGIYKEEDIFKECIRLVEEDMDTYYYSFIVYGLIKVLSYARKGKKIYVRFD